jgi:hypothetical protein
MTNSLLLQFIRPALRSVVGRIRNFKRDLNRPGLDDIEIQSRTAVEQGFVLPDLTVLENTVTGIGGMGGHTLFLYNLVSQTNAHLVVEIGLGAGDSTTIFLLATHRTGGKVISIDIQQQPLAEKKIDGLEMRDRWEFIHQPSEVAAQTWPVERKIDILLIDGKHSYNQVKLEYRLYRPLMQKNGYILFHDSETIQGVRKFTQELARQEGGIQFPYCNGLYAIRID